VADPDIEDFDQRVIDYLADEFRKENGAWRINLVPLLERVGRERSAQLGSASDENKAIIAMIEKASGRKVDNTIWTPPGLQ